MQTHNHDSCLRSIWQKRHVRLALALAFALLPIGLVTQRAAANHVTIQRTTSLKNFVIIFFRQGPHPLTDAEKQQRAEEIIAWARVQNAAGRNLEPHTLAPEIARRG